MKFNDSLTITYSMTRRQLLLILPALVGGLEMARSIYLSHFIREPTAENFVMAIALLGPFISLGVIAWRSRIGFISAMFALFPALLLSLVPFACFAFEYSEWCQYFLLLSPIYLWIVVLVAAILTNSNRRYSASDSP